MKAIGDQIVTNVNKRFPGRLVLLMFDVTYSSHVSNSHSSPRGKPSNFTRKEGIPTGYPGWSGRLWIWTNQPRTNGSGSDILRNSGIYSGTGGYGSYGSPIDMTPYVWEQYYPCSWDCKIWEDDFADISDHTRKYHADKAIATINNKPYSYPLELYGWVADELKNDSGVDLSGVFSKYFAKNSQLC